MKPNSSKDGGKGEIDVLLFLNFRRGYEILA